MFVVIEVNKNGAIRNVAINTDSLYAIEEVTSVNKTGCLIKLFFGETYGVKESITDLYGVFKDKGVSLIKLSTHSSSDKNRVIINKKYIGSIEDGGDYSVVKMLNSDIYRIDESFIDVIRRL